MSRRYTILLVLAAILLTGFSVALSRRDSRDWRANRSRRIFPFPWQDTASVSIAKPDGTSLLFKKTPAGEWQIQLDDESADMLYPGAVEEISALATLAWREAQKDRAAPSRDTAVILTAANQAGQKVEMAFGDISNNLRATIIDGDAQTVYGVNQDLLGFLDWPSERFRNLYLVNTGSGRKPKKIVLAPYSEDQSLVVSLENGPGGWRMTKPVSWPVDETRLDLLLRWLDRLRGESIEAEMTGDLEWFGFGPESGYVEAWYDAPQGEIHRRVEFGKDAGGGKIYARETGRNPVFGLAKETLSEISLDVAREHPVQWRNFYRLRGLNPLGEVAPQTVVIERLLPTPEKLTLEMKQDPAGAKWLGTLEDAAGSRQFAVEPPGGDPSIPMTALLTGLSSLRVKAFLTDTPPGPETIKWTAYPAWRFSARRVDGSETPALTLYAEDAQGNLPPGVPYVDGEAGPREMQPREGLPGKVGIAFSVADRPAVMETFGELAYLLCRPPYRYQSRRLVDSEPRHWNRVIVTNDKGEASYTANPEEVNEQWWRDAVPPEPLMDDNNRFVALLLELSQLRADGFVADVNGDIAEFGLDQPEITAIVYSSPAGGAGQEGDGRLFKLSLGKEADAEGSRYARLDDAGPVFLVPARIASALGEVYL